MAVVLGIANGLSTGITMMLGTDNAPSKNKGEFLGIWRLLTDGGSSDLFLQVFLLHYFPLTQGYFLLALLAALVQFLSFLELKKRHAMEGLHRMFDKALIDHIVINVKSRTAMIPILL